MPVIKIDGVQYQVEAGKNLLQAALELGLDLPYFCWHPAMGSMGACRQCAVVQYRDEADTAGRIVMSCMTPVTDGAIFSLDGDKAGGFREMVVESLMLNHPHDCPVCGEGGECHLQDMTVMVGHRDRHYRGKKNTHRNQQLGPLINHEMNRCIACYRCTRFYRDYAGGTDLAAMASHDHIYFGRHQDGTLESPFAGNLVEVCPTGVFTDKPLVHEYTRKWDLQSAPSVCVGCALGCNTMPGERYGKLKRIHNRYNHEVNGYFLCDRGRYGGQFVNREDRMNHAGSRQLDGSFQVIKPAAALQLIAAQGSDKRIAAIGSPRASVEANYLLQKLVGAQHFCSGIDDQEQEFLQRIIAHLGSSPAHNPSLRDVESADAILVLGENVTHTAPRLALALRQSVRNKAYELAAELGLESWQDAAIRNLAQEQRSPLHIIASGSTDLDDVAASTTYLTASDQALLAQDLASALAGDNNQPEHLQRIARDLKTARRPLVICGTAAGSAALIDAAAGIAAQLATSDRGAMLSFCLPECNSMGSTLLTVAGDSSLEEIAACAERGEIDTLIVMENELHRRCNGALLQRLRDNIDCFIGLDYLESATLAQCDLVLPSAGFTESEGTLVSSEGRAQRSFPTSPAAQDRRASWQWLLDIAAAWGREDLSGLGHVDNIYAACAGDHPLLAGIMAAAPDHTFRSHGLKIPRETHRYSGRTAMHAKVSVHEPKQPADQESALAYTMEGASRTDRPGALLTYVWSPGWNSNQSLHKFQSEIDGPLRGGTAGVRLLDGVSLAAPPSAAAPAAFAARPGEFLLQARHCIFGSDEMSSHSDSIKQLAGTAFVELNDSDAAALGVEEGDAVRLGQTSLEVYINSSIPRGSAGFSAGYDACAGLRSGQWAPLNRDDSWQRRQPQLIGTDRGGRHV
jgi:NADH-quinone oxidoreductase subunit G